MSKVAIWIAAGCLAFLMFLIIYLPAAQVLGRVSLPASIQLEGVSGTVWEGRATHVIYQGLLLENTKWDVAVSWLLLGKLKVNLDAGNARDSEAITIDGPITLNLFDHDAISSDDLSVYLPTDAVISRLPLPLPVNATGRFRIFIDEMRFNQGCVALTGEGQWLNGSVKGSTGEIPLGNFNADLACEGENIRVLIREPNKFGLSATATIMPDMSTSVTGRFKPDETLPQEVHSAAKFFGPPDAQGYYPIRF